MIRVFLLLILFSLQEKKSDVFFADTIQKNPTKQKNPSKPKISSGQKSIHSSQKNLSSQKVISIKKQEKLQPTLKKKIKQKVILPTILSNNITNSIGNNPNTKNSEFIEKDVSAKREKILIIPKIDFGDVNDWYYTYIRSCFHQAKQWEADAILLEIDTPGGYGDVASKIVSLILSEQFPVYIYINDNAISAGANIALAGNKIFMRKGAIIGGSQPVNSRGETHGEKYLSIFRSKFRSLAELRKRPSLICEAMVDPSIVLTTQEHGIDCPKGKLLTLSSSQAKKLKITDEIVNDRDELIEKIQFSDAKILISNPSISMRILRFFGSGMMRDFLQFLTYLGFAIEIRTPGWGFGGALAIASATLGFIIQLSFDKVEWFVPGAFGLGILLLSLEVFIFPGLGLTGALGIILCGGSLLFGMGIENVYRTIATGGITFTLCLVMVSVILGIISKTDFIRKLFSIDHQIDYVVGEPPPHEKTRVMMGAIGIVSIPLRPIGRVDFLQGCVEAACIDNKFMTKGKKVRVVGFDDFKVLVEEIKKK